MVKTQSICKSFETELGIEILVSYDETFDIKYSKDDFLGQQLIPEHEHLNTELTSLEIVIKGGNSVDILPLLSKNQLANIKKQIDE